MKSKVSERLQQLIDEKKMSPATFSKLIEKHQSQLSRWLKGDPEPSRSTCVEIAEKTSCSFEWLYSGVGTITQHAGRDTHQAGGDIKTKTISGVEYDRPGDQTSERAGETPPWAPYSSEDFYYRCFASFQVIFDWIAHKNGTDARAIESFKNKHIMKELMDNPDFRLWLYKEQQEE